MNIFFKSAKKCEKTPNFCKKTTKKCEILQKIAKNEKAKNRYKVLPPKHLRKSLKNHVSNRSPAHLLRFPCIFTPCELFISGLKKPTTKYEIRHTRYEIRQSIYAQIF